ncbi:MAG: hypothetical protein AAF368_17250, partial [Planctomycetota bacterium]
GPVSAEALRFLGRQLGGVEEPSRPGTPGTDESTVLVELVNLSVCTLHRPGCRVSGSVDGLVQSAQAHSSNACRTTALSFGESFKLDSSMVGTTWRYRVWSRDAEY